MDDGVYILGAGMIRFNKYPEKGIKQMTAEAVADLLSDARGDS